MNPQTPLATILNPGTAPQMSQTPQVNQPQSSQTSQIAPQTNPIVQANNARTHLIATNMQLPQQQPQSNQQQPVLALQNAPQAPSAQTIPQADGHEFDGLCEAYCESQKFGTTGIYPSAISAWDQSKNKVAGLNGIQPGDQIFFAPDSSNGGYGHTGIYEGNGKFTSATYNGVQTNDLSNWQQNTGQQLLGYTAE